MGQVQPPASPQVIIYHAGSLSGAFNSLAEAFAKKTGIELVLRGFGSLDAAKRASIGKESVDIYASADYSNIDAFLKPIYADYTIQFAVGGVVLAYTTDSKGAASIADPNGPAYNPPASVPNAAANWYTVLLADGVKIGGFDPNTDPGGYRVFHIMQLAQRLYGTAALYDNLRKKYSITTAGQRLGTDFDYQFPYEHSARSTAKTNERYRYVRLPAAVGLSDPAHAKVYRQASFDVAGFAPGDPPKPILGTRVTFGLTILKNAPHPNEALAFLQFMFSSEGIELQKPSGPDPIKPVVSADDFKRLPRSLQSLVGIERR